VDAGRADVWSMGISLYAMVVGRTPWGQASRDDPAFAACLDRGGVVEVPRHVSAALADLLHGMLRVDPGARLSLEEVRAHPWVASASAPAPAPPACPSLAAKHPPPSGLPRHHVSRSQAQEHRA
jgi:serine/threonine protein kinase